MQGTPDTMQSQPKYVDVVAEIRQFFADRLSRLAEHGVSASQIVLDPGIGFGKTLEHNLALLRSPRLFAGGGRPMMLGVSRKSFLGVLFQADVHQRVAAGLACTLWARQAGVQIFRTHDVAQTVQALGMWEKLMGKPDPTCADDRVRGGDN